MKPQLLLTIFLLGMLGCAPPSGVDITQSAERSASMVPAAASAGKYISSGIVEGFESDFTGEEVIQTTKDQIESLQPLTPVEASPIVTLIQPDGIVDLRELEVGNIDMDDVRLEEMPNPQLDKTKTTFVEQAKQKLAAKLGIELEAISQVSSTIVESPDGKLNCQTKDGGRRSPRVTFIYLITLEAAGYEYIYYVEPGGTLSICAER